MPDWALGKYSLRNTAEPVGAGLAGTPQRREEVLETAKSFAGKPCSYSTVCSRKMDAHRKLQDQA